MIHLSKGFRKLLADDIRDYSARAEIVLEDSTRIDVSPTEIWSDGFNVEDAVSDDEAFTALGATVINAATLTLDNTKDIYTDYDFKNADVKMYISAQVPDTVDGEEITRTDEVKMGTFRVDDTAYNEATISLSMLDYMEQFDRPYSRSTLTYPATLNQIVRDACQECSVTLSTLTFPHDDFIVQTRPTDDALTFREVISWCATIAGCFARCNRDGELQLKWFNTAALETEDGADGGEFDSGSPYYNTGDNISGGTFNPWSTGAEVDGGNFTDEIPLHYIGKLYSQSICVDETVITGVEATVEDNESEQKQTQHYTAGTDGYKIQITGNKFLTKDNAQAVVNWLGQQLIGLRFRKCIVTHADDPSIEAGDVGLLYDAKQREYPILITRHAFDISGPQTIVCGSDTPAHNSAARFSQATKNEVEIRKRLKEQKSNYDQIIRQLAEDIEENAHGLYADEIEDPDNPGAMIRCLHDKPEINDSDVRIHISDLGIFVTQNGTAQTPTWYGWRVNGDAISRIMNTIGINFDWGVGGALRIEDSNGNETFYADADTGVVRIKASSFSLSSGDTINTIAQAEASKAVTTATQYTDTKLADYKDEVQDIIDDMQAQIDGQVETWYYDYEPTMNNLPASEWTTEALRKDHEGDIFYNVDNGYAYRFIKTGSTWGWKYIEDSMVTDAIAKAEKAQDTADSKRRIFVTQPYPPYDIGDLWAQGSTGDLMRCETARATGSYISTDWRRASRYTDDSYAENMIIGGRNFALKTGTEKSVTVSGTEPSGKTGAYTFSAYAKEVLAGAVESTKITLSFDYKAVLEGTGSTIDLRGDINGRQGHLQWALNAPLEGHYETKSRTLVADQVTPSTVSAYFRAPSTATKCTFTVSNLKVEVGDKATDWTPAPEDAEAVLQDWISGEYADTIAAVKTQVDKKAETWYQAADPSEDWTTAAAKAEHKGDLWFCTATSGNYKQKTWQWDGTKWQEVKTTPPADVMDTIDGKAQIFVARPVPPYSVGDLWFDSATADIMTCITARESGSFTAGDWQKRNKYTDDTALSAFTNGDYARFVTATEEGIHDAQTTAGKKITTFYQEEMPTGQATGDLWISKGDGNKLYRWNGTAWTAVQDAGIQEAIGKAGTAQTTADGKIMTYAQNTAPANTTADPLDVGDLWIDTDDNNKLYRWNGSSWIQYTDTSSLHAWIEGEYADTLTEVKSQIDQKAETWYQASDPAEAWTTDQLKSEHKGDLWYCTATSGSYGNGQTYRWSGTAWTKQTAPKEVFDQINGKAQIFTGSDLPTPPYYVGDLWFNSTADNTGDIYTCVTSQTSGSGSANHWKIRNRYTDDSYAENMAVGGRNLLLETALPSDITKTASTASQLSGVVGAYLFTEYGKNALAGAVESATITVSFDYKAEVAGSNCTLDIHANINSAQGHMTWLFDAPLSGRYVATSRTLTSSQVTPATASAYFRVTNATRCKFTISNFKVEIGDKATDWTPSPEDQTAEAAELVNELDNSLDQDAVFNRLTNGGVDQGIYLNPEDKKLYINFNFARGGTLKLGGVNNGNGVLELYDSSNNLFASLTNAGWLLARLAYAANKYLMAQMQYTDVDLKTAGTGKNLSNQFTISTGATYPVSQASGSLTAFGNSTWSMLNFIFINQNNGGRADGYVVTHPQGACFCASSHGIGYEESGKASDKWTQPLFIGMHEHCDDSETKVFDIAVLNDSFEVRLDKATAGRKAYSGTPLARICLGAPYAKDGTPYFDVAYTNSSASIKFRVTTTQALVNNKALAFASSGSSRRYKHDIKDIYSEELDPHKLLKLRVVQFVFNDDHIIRYEDMRGKTIPGFIAEEVAEAYPAAVIHDEETGQVENWDERRIIPGMLALIQEQDAELKRQAAEIEELKRQLAEVTELVRLALRR